MAGDAITRGDIGGLGSPVYIYDYTRDYIGNGRSY